MHVTPASVLALTAIVEGAPLLAGILGFWNIRQVFVGPVRPAGWVLAVLVPVAYIATTYAMEPGIAAFAFGPWPLKGLALLAAVTGAFTEELLFRRMLIEILLRRRIPRIAAALTSGIAFGIAHLVWSPTSPALVVGFTGALGFALAMTYLLGNRRLLPCVLAHFAIDAVLEPGLLHFALASHP
ncbi:MAG TPA: CPBP family intramembrane glutamic endopeptidase [Candidatus Baltobacteraceae bacterium]|nr:CPBP family intramembrane glutamic endopeptidase [Candidatus Baltobacteraceae bacterium]